MESPIQITYLQHSGFAIRTGDTLLVFDDAQGLSDNTASLAQGRISPALVDSHGQTVFFVSHAHSDHFHPGIYALAGDTHVQYILGYDLDEEYRGRRMRPGESISLDGINITAYDSTDEGVSYLVKIHGWTLFHAGDLNLWHWRSESTLKEIEQAEHDYLQAVEPLIGEHIDFAFFPLDPRMGALYEAGALHFMMHVKPRIFIPMHWWGRSDAVLDFTRRNQTKRVEIVPLTIPGQTIRAQKQADGHILLTL